MYMCCPAYGGPPRPLEPLTCNVIMVDCGPNKIAVIKYLKQKKIKYDLIEGDTPLCLHDAMVVVNNPGAIVYRKMFYDNSLPVKKELEELGSVIELDITEYK